DWFALYGGKRHYSSDTDKNQLCYSNPELFEAAVRYARVQFDTYDFDTVSIMPPDGYTAICQCPLCEGKDDPDTDPRGLLSDYVWDFVNRVAKEVGKTHPGKRILNCAYGVYTQPPRKIAKLEPNVQVCIVGGRRPASDKPEEQAEIRKLREAWAAKTDHPILIFENYPFTDRGWYLPAFFPTVLGDSINATKGMSQGEDIWLSVRQDFDRVGIGFNHFLVYFTARMYWGGPDQDIGAMFDEYCRLFYGPAAPEMKAFFAYCEANWREMEKEKEKADRCLELFGAAVAKVDAGSIHGRRLALIDEFLKGLRNKSEQLGKKRGPVPVTRLVGDARDIVVDGNLDDAYWQNCPVAATGKLRELQTGRQPIFGTSFQAGWAGNNVYFAIRCEERPGEALNLGTEKDDDAALWYGDAIEILLETDSHSYYQIAVGPNGAVVDMDWQGKKRDLGWDSQAEAATRIADDHWTLEIRIPVTQDENDPLHQVIGRKPTQSLPWHLNICRQRIRDDGAEYSALSPTATAGFHEPMKFAYFYDGRSHSFEADPTVTDFLIESRAAAELLRQRKAPEALNGFLALSERDRATDFQKSDALEQAAQCARLLKDPARAEEIASRIPIESVAKTVRMLNALDQRQTKDAVATFGTEDIGAWPFWQRGAAWFARGRIFSAEGDGPRAESDLTNALEFVNEPRLRLELQLAIAQNRERNLKDATGALKAYREMVESTGQNGSSTYFSGVLGAARLLRESGKFDDAIATVGRVDTEKLRGTWRGQFLLAAAEVRAAAGKKEEAIAAYQAILADDLVEEIHKKAAAAALELLK
ncbi:MAG: DUF4838 domain-containing protein, partial [Verrucomicrobiae bacterium]|nr:DUF4838 domain-containing protein [Verrucomicrobiae bacterium]